MFTQLKPKNQSLVAPKNLAFKTAYEYRVSGGGPGGGIPGGIPVIDTYGNFRPSAVFGQTYFVDYRNGDDSNNGLSKGNARKTFSSGLSLVTSNNNDFVVIDGDSTVVETAMVDNSKNRFSVLGVGGGVLFGQGTKISVTATTGATNIGTYQNTGVRTSYAGIKFINSSTVTEGIYCIAEGGEYSVYTNCEFYKDTDLDETAASEFLHNGDSTQFFGCTFGSSANIVADNCIRPNVKLTATLAGKKCRDTYFENCLFLSKAGGTEKVMVYGANATDVERMLLMKNCTFMNNVLSAATPAHAVGFGAAQTEGSVLLQDCASVDCTVMAQASVGIYVAGAVPTFATTGVSKAS